MKTATEIQEMIRAEAVEASFGIEGVGGSNSSADAMWTALRH